MMLSLIAIKSSLRDADLGAGSSPRCSPLARRTQDGLKQHVSRDVVGSQNHTIRSMLVGHVLG